MPALDVLRYTNAREFNEVLQLTHELWCPAGTVGCNWVFRGHADAAWELKPRAWRPDGLKLLAPLRRDNEGFASEKVARLNEAPVFRFREGPPAPPIDRVREVLLQTATEYVAVTAFADLADEIGHPAPRDGLDEWQRFINCESRTEQTTFSTLTWFEEYWPGPPNLVMALAQHHGVPTRLLDFTRRAAIAAFFAADEAADNRQVGTPPDAIAVWAVNRVALGPGRIKLYTCPRHQMVYLHAQDGVFLWDAGAHRHYLDAGQWPSFDSVILTDFAQVPECPPLVRKIILPMEHVNPLLDLLSIQRISRAHLMPTYDNVTATLKSRWGRRSAKKEP